jgi:hypothetical protein
MAEGIKLYEAGVRYTKEEANQRSVEVQLEGGGSEPLVFDTEEVEARKWAWVYGELERQGQRKHKVWQIDTWLAQRGSPMVGCGEYYVQNEERTGIPAALSVGIAEAESSSGMANFAPHNAWGMIGYPGGWSSWEEGIAANFDFLVRYFGCPQNMMSCPGYCEGNTTMQTVDSVQRMVESL